MVDIELYGFESIYYYRFVRKANLQSYSSRHTNAEPMSFAHFRIIPPERSLKARRLSDNPLILRIQRHHR